MYALSVHTINTEALFVQCTCMFSMYYACSFCWVSLLYQYLYTLYASMYMYTPLVWMPCFYMHTQFAIIMYAQSICSVYINAYYLYTQFASMYTPLVWMSPFVHLYPICVTLSLYQCILTVYPACKNVYLSMGMQNHTKKSIRKRCVFTIYTH